MSQNALRRTLIGLAGFLLLVVCSRFIPISISLGCDEEGVKARESSSLRPGQWYIVYSDESIASPHGGAIRLSGVFGTALTHSGLRKDKGVPCEGAIKTVLRDDGCIEYECVVCKRKWIRDAEGKLVKACNED